MYTNIKIEEENSKRGLFARLNSYLNKNFIKISKKLNFELNFRLKILSKLLIIIFIIIPIQITHPQDIEKFSKNESLEINSLVNLKYPKNTNSTEGLFLSEDASKKILLKSDKEIALKTNNPKNTKNVWVTAYSSSFDETDDDPFITASGKFVQDGFVATNILPLGTKIKIPEIFGEKIFVVEDRMHSRKQNVVDVWMESKEKAIKFGAHYTNIVILEDSDDNFANLNLVSKTLD
jgi:3D (Asp-Asp-Asp) domain-containing protein